MPPKDRGRRKLPVPLPKDMILKDTEGKVWRLGTQIGQGGFGLIYLASPQTHVPVEDDAVHVIKVEYLENGPLFSELKFYQRAAKQEHTIDSWSWRDWGKTFKESLKIVEADLRRTLFCNLEHECWILWNIYMKMSMFMVTLKQQIYFWAIPIHMRCERRVKLPVPTLPATRSPYCKLGTFHFRPAPSRRGDLEILGYCMLQWLCGKLPWEQNLKDPVAVQSAKTKLMDELPDSVMEWDSSGSSCSEISKFLACVYGLAYDEKPKYQALKKILLDGLKSSGTDYDGPLEFSTAARTRNRSAAEVSKVSLPKPMPKPVQQKPKKLEGEGSICQNKACTGVRGKQLQDEEKASKLKRILHQTEPQQVPPAKPAPKPVQQEHSEVKEEDSTCLSRAHARLTRRQFQAEEKPDKFYTTLREPGRDRPPQKDTARELPAFDPQTIFSQSKKNHNQLLTTAHPVWLEGGGSAITTPSLSVVFGLAFADETYHYSVAILVLLLLIVLSLYLL
ncbi:serine/threonine-protein kinase VRK2 isoform 2-T2 [Alca torda]